MINHKTEDIKSVVNLQELFRKQQALTDYICEKQKMDGPDTEKDVVAIICELYETANELKSEGFKYWTRKKRTTEVLEESIDILHLLLQVGNSYHVPTEHPYIEKRKTILDQIKCLNLSLLMCDGPIMWVVCMAQYRGLVTMLGFDWEDDIIPAYDLKYEENRARQDRGY